MPFVVPFDDSDLAKAALSRAVEFSRILEEPIVVVSIIPERDVRYAKAHGWLADDEAFDYERIINYLQQSAINMAPNAEFRHSRVDRYASPGVIAGRIRQLARELDASMVFIGSENAGRIVSAVSSVGNQVAADQSYDVVIIRANKPSTIPVLNADSHQNDTVT